jgi:hypothetical protein
MFDQNLLVGLVVLGLVGVLLYSYFPALKKMVTTMRLEGFADAKNEKKPGMALMGQGAQPLMGENPANGATDAPKLGAADSENKHVMPVPVKGAEGFSDYEATMAAVPMTGAQKPAGCYPREQLNPMELLPSDPNSQWAQVNPTGAGDIQGKNFLSAGALIGINTIGQSMRNANLQLRAEPPCPQQQVSPWLQSTIEPDLSRRPLDF